MLSTRHTSLQLHSCCRSGHEIRAPTLCSIFDSFVQSATEPHTAGSVDKMSHFETEGSRRHLNGTLNQKQNVII